MKHVSKTVLAASAVACATLLTIGWSEQGGISLSVGSAQARVGRPLTPMSAAGVARRHTRRAAYGAAAVGAGVAAAGTAAAVAATSPHWGPGYPGYYGGPYAAYGYTPQDRAAANGWICQPGTLVKLEDGRMHRCQ